MTHTLMEVSIPYWLIGPLEGGGISGLLAEQSA
jgi:hypothetical protein